MGLGGLGRILGPEDQRIRGVPDIFELITGPVQEGYRARGNYHTTYEFDYCTPRPDTQTPQRHAGITGGSPTQSGFRAD